jgi:gliding motility-associated-like protein
LTYALDTVPFLESPSFTGLTPGKYTVFVRAGRLGCPAIREVEVAGFAAPAIRSVEAIAASCRQADGRLTLLAEAGVPPLTYSLNEGALQTAPLFPDLASGRYEVIVRDSAGCEIRDSVEVAAERCRVFVPNAFSPNGDGVNDRFHIFTPDAALTFPVLFQIFDRWGGLVYQYSAHQAPDTEDYGWDGTIRGRPAGTGTYLYLLELEFDNGERERRSGTLTLLR